MHIITGETCYDIKRLEKVQLSKPLYSIFWAILSSRISFTIFRNLLGKCQALRMSSALRINIKWIGMCVAIINSYPRMKAIGTPILSIEFLKIKYHGSCRCITGTSKCSHIHYLGLLAFSIKPHYQPNAPTKLLLDIKLTLNLGLGLGLV